MLFVKSGAPPVIVVSMFKDNPRYTFDVKVAHPPRNCAPGGESFVSFWSNGRVNERNWIPLFSRT